jgi:DNA-binding NarL/FixJ family response regulator
MPEPIRVSIVDDDSVVRTSLRLMIGHLDGYQLVSTHASADDALELLPGLAPAIVLLDVRMPGMSGIACARRLHQVLPEVRIVMVTAYVEDALIADAFRAGAIGYVTKPFRPEVVAQALEHARQGVIHLEGLVSERFSAWMHERSTRPLAVLSERELAVLSRVRRGCSDKEIAHELSLSEPTVKGHIRQILSKLKVNSRSAAVSVYFEYF